MFGAISTTEDVVLQFVKSGWKVSKPSIRIWETDLRGCLLIELITTAIMNRVIAAGLLNLNRLIIGAPDLDERI